MIEYFVTRDSSGEIVGLSRIRRTATATNPELLRDGVWIPWPSLMEKLFDRDPRDSVSADQAAVIAARLGGSL